MYATAPKSPCSRIVGPWYSITVGSSEIRASLHKSLRHMRSVASINELPSGVSNTSKYTLLSQPAKVQTPFPWSVN